MDPDSIIFIRHKSEKETEMNTSLIYPTLKLTSFMDTS